LKVIVPMYKTIAILFCCMLSSVALAQSHSVQGTLLDESSTEPIDQAVVSIGSSTTTQSDANGRFLIENINPGIYNIKIQHPKYTDFVLVFEIKQKDIDLGVLLMESNFNRNNLGNLISLSDSELGDDENDSYTSAGLLQASRDLFLNRAAFDFGQVFFRVRGYDSGNGDLLINGVRMNKLATGRPQWNNWGGLNDATRNQVFTNGLELSDYGFGGISGTTNINTLASEYRSGTRVTSSTSNRSYTGRLMATYNTGLLPSGWAASLSASRRWAEEGFVDGTLYDAYSIFGSLSYQPNDSHQINATFIYASNRRGSSSAITEEIYNLVGRTYNPYWGKQDGKIRNSRERKIAEPIVMLTHQYSKEKVELTTSIAYQTGQFGRMRLQYQNAPHPAPDYYRYLPSYKLNEGSLDYNIENAELTKQLFLSNPQIDWTTLYRYNLNNQDQQSVYTLSEDRNDDTQLSFSSTLMHKLNDRIKIIAGINATQLDSENFAELSDLLGGSFYKDYDPFSNTSNNVGANNIKKVGDRISYNYTIDASVIDGFLQAEYSTQNAKIFASGFYSNTSYQRNGLFDNELFSNSLGKGEKLSFDNIGFKAGLNYSLSGGHNLSFHTGYLTKAPNIRNAFSNARTSNDITPEITSEKIMSIDASYIVQTPTVKARLTGFYTQFVDATEVSFFYAQGISGAEVTQDFFSEALTGVNKTHMGLELGTEVQLNTTFKATAVAALGQYTYSNNPEVYLSSDQISTRSFGPSALKDYRVANGPQQAYSIGLEYRSPKYWWTNLTANHLSHNYADVSPISRTQNFYINPESPNGSLFPDISEDKVRDLLRQHRLDDVFLLNLTGGKSWRIEGNYLSLFVSINNLLDASYRTGGYEQSRAGNYEQLSLDNANGTPSFGPKYFYGYGRTYFINLAYSF